MRLHTTMYIHMPSTPSTDRHGLPRVGLSSRGLSWTITCWSDYWRWSRQFCKTSALFEMLLFVIFPSLPEKLKPSHPKCCTCHATWSPEVMRNFKSTSPLTKWARRRLEQEMQNMRLSKPWTMGQRHRVAGWHVCQHLWVDPGKFGIGNLGFGFSKIWM